MEVIKFSDFLINEAKVQKDEVKKAILDFLKEKPTINATNKNWPTQKGIYLQGSIVKHLSKYNSTTVLNSLADLSSDKEIESIRVKNIEYKHTYPYYYIDLSKEEANKIKDKYEAEDVENHKNDKKPTKKATKEAKPKRKPASSKSPIEKKEKKK
jgi:hypothetical protein